ncbi:MAG TPA: pyruvate kinase [Saprospiraceae bacterium]|nr:pyruvate kinase [Saprospiraceae bacterium]HPN68589.1 pyruvate kinase [Saprospiraceae bacterium]
MESHKQLQYELQLLEKKIITASSNCKKQISSLHQMQQKSATNLIQYLALRNQDIRALQDELHHAGLSSLASSESHVLKQVQSIRQRLGATLSEKELSDLDYYSAQNTLNVFTGNLFGLKKDPSIPHIMVTLDTTFAENIPVIKKLIEAGMNVARINCAHGDEKNWMSLIEAVHNATVKSGSACKIYMDIAGPKMRVDLPGKGKEEGKLKVSLGMEILLVEPGVTVKRNQNAIACYELGVLDNLKDGERIIIDDGKFEGLVVKKNKKQFLKITRVPAQKSFIKKDKGLNLPDTHINVPALTKEDLKSIPFIAKHADLVGCSFLRDPADLKLIRKAFKKYKKKPKLILKIETPDAVINLPSLLIEAMKDESYGVMIARGDLAVEIGFERLSEIQDEILWICEAAHAPVIWATQVLETFSKSGIATRSEVTDAAHAAKAECVMLNKGDYIIDTIKLLKKILNKSTGHRQKKRYSMRPLNIAAHFFNQSKSGQKKLLVDHVKIVETSS